MGLSFLMLMIKLKESLSKWIVIFENFELASKTQIWLTWILRGLVSLGVTTNLEGLEYGR